MQRVDDSDSGNATQGHVTVATYVYDGSGRRIKKVLTKRGNLDGTEYYYSSSKFG